MSRQGKRYRADAQKTSEEAVPLTEAVNRLKAFKAAKFDQTVEIALHLGVDPKQAEQNIRGSLSLPHGIGASKRVIAFCTEDKLEAARAAGAVEAGGEDLVAKIEGGWMDFDVAVAEPAMMRVVAKLGRSLGPKGLMPSPKNGTVTPNVEQAVTEFSAGKVNFKNDKLGNVHAVIGKHSMGVAELEGNAQAFIDHIVRLRPSTIKGQYVKNCAITATMTPSVTVQV